jgi:V/A-type H+-transporting ATPase subunit I
MYWTYKENPDLSCGRTNSGSNTGKNSQGEIPGGKGRHMIVPMKKITLLCLKVDQEMVLHTLHEMGVLHVTHSKHPVCNELEKEKKYYYRLQRAFDTLPLNSERKTTADTLEVTLEKIEKLVQRRKEVEELCEKLNYERQRVQPYGNFDPARLSSLAKSGINVRLYRSPANHPTFAPEGSTLFMINKDRNFNYFVIVGRGNYQCGYEEFQIPGQSLTEIEASLFNTEKALKAISEEFVLLSGEKDVINEALVKAKERIRFLEVKRGMGSTENIVYLQGFCPADNANEILKAPSLKGCGSSITDPSTEDDVPTLMRNPRWVQPIKTIFDMINILPGYMEKDISGVFLIFFSVFSALLIGDAGYGAIFLLITMVSRKVFSKALSAPFFLLGILSVCTMVWGVLTGNYFGVSNIPAPFKTLRVEWLTNEKNIMHFCFFIGSIHLTVAHAWNAIRMINSTKVVAQIGWICMTWTMYITARTMILDATFPAWGYYLLFTALGCVVLFITTPGQIKKDWADLMMFPLNIISNFVDVVSYIRLFAVGSASLAVATSFNEMALEKGISNVFTGLIAAMILFLGHGLNIALMALGILVHGVRLNTLEFSGHVGVQWKGIPYHPFSKSQKINC